MTLLDTSSERKRAHEIQAVQMATHQEVDPARKVSRVRRTSWFTSGERPARTGVYQVRWKVFMGMDPEPIVCIAYAYWSRRKGWRQDGTTPRGALRRNHYPHAVASPHWRGLTKGPHP